MIGMPTLKTKMYRSQHEEIGKLAAAIPMEGPLPRPLDIQLALGRLKGLLNVHLKLEDENLYPAMMRHPSDLVRAKAAKYQREMGSLAGAFADFYVTWTEPGAIEARPAFFQSEWSAVLGALKARIEAEETDLYEAVDAYVELPAQTAR